MPEVLAKITSAPHPWVVSTDPAGLLTVTPAAPLVVQYSTGGSDTVPAGVAAAECPLAAGYIWCPYIVPGDGTLHAVKEHEIATLAGDYSILGHVHQHEVVPHQVAGAGGLAALEFLIDGGGAVLSTGVQGALVVPFGCTITSAELLADQSGDLVVDVWKSDYAGYPSGSGDSITSATPPTLSGAQKSQDTTLASWTTGLAAGDVLVYSITSVATITWCTVALLVLR